MGDSTGEIVTEEVAPAAPVAPSWAPRPSPGLTVAKQPAAGRLREALKSYVSWVIVLTTAVDALAATFELFKLLRHGVPFHAAVAATLAAFGLSVLFAMAAALPIGLVYAAVRLDRAPATAMESRLARSPPCSWRA